MRQDYLIEGTPVRLKTPVRRKIAGRGKQAGFVRCIETLIGAQDFARIDPDSTNPRSVQERRAERGCHQFTHGHDSRASCIADAAMLCQTLGQYVQLSRELFELRIGIYAQALSEKPVGELNLLEDGCMRPRDGGRQQRFKPIGDA